jgi:YD repeat-containing protein
MAFFDAQDRPTHDKAGVSVTRMTYDEAGKELTRVVLDEKGNILKPKK